MDTFSKAIRVLLGERSCSTKWTALGGDRVQSLGRIIVSEPQGGVSSARQISKPESTFLIGSYIADHVPTTCRDFFAGSCFPLALAAVDLSVLHLPSSFLIVSIDLAAP